MEKYILLGAIAASFTAFFIWPCQQVAVIALFTVAFLLPME